MLNSEVLDEVDLYECEEHIAIPLCMKQGSLRNSVDMMGFNDMFDFMMSRRVHDVQHH